LLIIFITRGVDNMKLSKKFMPIGLVAIVCFAVVISGCTSSNNSTSNQATPSSSSSSSTASVAIQVSYPGSWTGNIGSSSGSRSVQGTGSQTFQLGSNPGTVSATFQKSDNNTGTLTASILSGGSVVETQSTTADSGVVSVSHSF
jgi:hypothetical protein